MPQEVGKNLKPKAEKMMLKNEVTWMVVLAQVLKWCTVQGFQLFPWRNTLKGYSKFPADGHLIRGAGWEEMAPCCIVKELPKGHFYVSLVYIQP